jgi:hypothetical protein
MSDLVAFVQLGFHHIADPAALDHVLFLLALAAIYRGRDWRSAVWVATAFTVGHSVTLALDVTGALRLPTTVIEFLIPVTIVATGIENLLVHGAGFANYLRDFFSGSIAVPLLGFNLGIELGQLLILAAAGLTLAAVDLVLGHRVRVVAVSAMVVIVAATMAVERTPW